MQKTFQLHKNELFPCDLKKSPLAYNHIICESLMCL